MEFFGIKSVRTRQGKTLVVMFSSLVRETKRLAGNVICRTPVDAGADMGVGKEKSVGTKNVERTGTPSKSELCKRCGDSGHTAVKCPDQVCGVCGGKGHAPEICGNVVSVFLCQTTHDVILSGEEEEAFI